MGTNTNNNGSITPRCETSLVSNNSLDNRCVAVRPFFAPSCATGGQTLAGAAKLLRKRRHRHFPSMGKEFRLVSLMCLHGVSRVVKVVRKRPLSRLVISAVH